VPPSLRPACAPIFTNWAIAPSTPVFHMATLTRRLRTMIVRLAPNLVLTQAYEGGHPDHDAVAFAVHHAVRGLTKPPPVWEMTAYHRANGTTVRGSFLPFDGPPIVRAPLDTAARALKRRHARLLSPRSSDVVAQFPLDEEDFRPAPQLRFHPAGAWSSTRLRIGRLGYEMGAVAGAGALRPDSGCAAGGVICLPISGWP